MKASIIIPYYSGRRKQFERTMFTLSKQTHEDFEVIVIDDGSDDYDEHLEIENKYVVGMYHLLRERGAAPRSPNMAYRKGYELAQGEIIILSNPEVLVPFNALKVMLINMKTDRRNVPVQYHLTYKQLKAIDTVDWRTNIHKLIGLPDFWSTQTPWLYTNAEAHQHRNHLNFCGATREVWDRYDFMPATDEWMNMENWLHPMELRDGYPATGIGIEVYHQEHPRHYGSGAEKKYSARIQRMRDNELG